MKAPVRSNECGYRGESKPKHHSQITRICKEKCWRISIKAKRILVFLCFKQNMVLERQLVEDYGSKLENSSFKYGGSRGLMDRALDLKPEVTGLNPGSGRKCPRLR